jgi:murein DD-endopeptidase MepM/ murein hydrolase activator NlpD
VKFSRLLLLLLIIPGPIFAQAFLYIPESTQQGEPFPMLFSWRESTDGATLRLTDPNGRVVAATGSFPVPLPGNGWIYAGLLGIPSTAEPGTYRILLSESRRSGEVLLEKDIVVEKKQFLREDIPLTYALSELRQSDDPRKVEEALELRKIVRHFDPESFYHPGTHINPLPEHRVTSFFGDRRRYHYTDQQEASAIHNGIDLAAPIGSSVHASAAGKVVFAGNRIITGNSIVIEHLPGLFSLYYHLESVLVEPGDLVEQGRVIGTVGMTGLATGPHLHWELRASGVAVNPTTFLEHPLIDKESIIGNIDWKP